MNCPYFMVGVAETVPRPDIRISVISSNLSSAFCKITVNCSIQDDWMLSVCDEDGCRISQKSLSSVNITISAENRTVVCSASNEVSTSNVSKDMDAMCQYNVDIVSSLFIDLLLI